MGRNRLRAARKGVLVGIMLIMLFGPAQAQENTAAPFAVTGVRVFDGEHVHEEVDVIVRDGAIAAVGPGLAMPDGIAQIDGTGQTLIPGLIDSHVHVFPGAQADALRFGVTTVLDMYHLGGPEAARAFRRQRESPGPVTAADTYTSLAGATPPGGHPSQLGEPGQFPTLGPTERAHEFVRAQLDAGADYIKIIQDGTVIAGTPLVKFSERRLAEIIEAVHAEGTRAIVHVSAHDEALLAVESGADMLAHVFQDQVASDELVRLAAERNAAVIATLSVLARASGTGHVDRLLAHDGVAERLSGAQQQTISGRFGREQPEIIERALASVGRFHAAGVDVLAGTDAPNPGTAHGLSIHQELELLVEAGLSPAAALKAATALPAARFGLDDRGRIAPGMRADLVLVAGNPLEDVERTRDIVRIWKNGFDVDRSAPSVDDR